MAWIVMALVIAVAIGPILWLLPSKRDKRLAEFRAAARSAGLVVEMVAVPKLNADAAERVSAGGVARDAKIDCVAYRLPLPRPLSEAPRWQLLKSERDSHCLRGWTSLDPPINLPVPAHDYWQRIGSIINALPGGCIGVQAGAHTISWLGRERTEGNTVATVVEDIQAKLETIGILHGKLHAAAMGDDS